MVTEAVGKIFPMGGRDSMTGTQHGYPNTHPKPEAAEKQHGREQGKADHGGTNKQDVCKIANNM